MGISQRRETPEQIAVFYCAKHYGLLAQVLKGIARENDHIIVYAPDTIEKYCEKYRSYSNKDYSLSARFIAVIDVDKKWIDNPQMIPHYVRREEVEVYAYGWPSNDAGHKRSDKLISNYCDGVSNAWEYDNKISIHQMNKASRSKVKDSISTAIRKNLLAKLEKLFGLG